MYTVFLRENFSPAETTQLRQLANPQSGQLLAFVCEEVIVDHPAFVELHYQGQNGRVALRLPSSGILYTVSSQDQKASPGFVGSASPVSSGKSLAPAPSAPRSTPGSEETPKMPSPPASAPAGENLAES
jgi:hypothetical protein